MAFLPTGAPRSFMRIFQRSLALIGGIALSAAISAPLKAQKNSNGGTVVLNARATESLSVIVTGGPIVDFTLRPNTAANAGSTTTTIQTSWVLQFGRTALSLWAWVPNGAAALTDGAGDNIPASAVTATAAGSGSAGGALNTSTSGGAGVPAFVTPAAATGVQIGQVRFFLFFNLTGNTTTTLTWNINTTGVPQLPAGNYTGIVNIQAQATP